MVDMKQSECTVRYCVTESLFTRQGFISYSALLQHQSSILHHQAYIYLIDNTKQIYYTIRCPIKLLPFSIKLITIQFKVR